MGFDAGILSEAVETLAIAIAQLRDTLKESRSGNRETNEKKSSVVPIGELGAEHLDKHVEMVGMEPIKLTSVHHSSEGGVSRTEISGCVQDVGRAWSDYLPPDTECRVFES